MHAQSLSCVQLCDPMDCITLPWHLPAWECWWCPSCLSQVHPGQQICSPWPCPTSQVLQAPWSGSLVVCHSYTLLRIPKSFIYEGCVYWYLLLEKTLERPLDCKEIKLVHPKGNPPRIFTGRTGAEAPILWPPDTKSWLIGKDPDARKYWRQEKRMTQWIWVWVNSGK